MRFLFFFCITLDWIVRSFTYLPLNNTPTMTSPIASIAQPPYNRVFQNTIIRVGFIEAVCMEILYGRI